MNMNRRTFTKKTTLGLSLFAMPACSYSRIIGANERINFGVVGLNGRGQAHVSAVALCDNSEVTALCDVDSRVFAKVQKDMQKRGTQQTETYGDIRKLLENKDIDVITIAAPDHWHAPMAMMAMNAGKDVYLEKPCCHNPQEGEWLIQSQKKTGKVLAIGNQQRSAPTSIKAVNDIRDGIIGEVYNGKSWYTNSRGSIGIGKEANIPDWLDWDLWQGPAPRKNYKDNWVHYNWHWFWNWGTGEINNNGLHEMDICRWALGVDIPNKVTSAGGRYHFKDDWEFYDTQVASFEFEGGKMLTWEGLSCNNLPKYNRGRGTTIHGTKGTILLDRNIYILYDLNGNVIKEEKEESMSATTDLVGIGALDVYHMKNFTDAIRKGEKLNSNIEEAHKSTLMCHLGNMAQKTNTALQIDTKTGKVLNSKEAMNMWGRTYEKGWKPVV
jgi:predicted dehydrogenase